MPSSAGLVRMALAACLWALPLVAALAIVGVADAQSSFAQEDETIPDEEADVDEAADEAPPAERMLPAADAAPESAGPPPQNALGWLWTIARTVVHRDFPR